MRNLPSGTVTFLFTDIEGSTKLARDHPATWEAARARHHAILKSAIESHNGYVFQVEMNYLASRLGFRSAEIPIYFADRRWGKSKMNFRIQLEAASSTWKLLGRYKDLPQR